MARAHSLSLGEDILTWHLLSPEDVACANVNSRLVIQQLRLKEVLSPGPPCTLSPALKPSSCPLPLRLCHLPCRDGVSLTPASSTSLHEALRSFSWPTIAASPAPTSLMHCSEWYIKASSWLSVSCSLGQPLWPRKQWAAASQGHCKGTGQNRAPANSWNATPRLAALCVLKYNKL